MIETIIDRLNEQVEWLELHGKKPSRIELGQLAAKQLAKEHEHISCFCRELAVNNILDLDKLHEQVAWLELHGKAPIRAELGKIFYRKLLCESRNVRHLISQREHLVYWCGLEVLRSESPRDPWRAFVYCSDDPTENP